LHTNGERTMNQSNRNNQCQIARILLHVSSNTLKWSACNADLIARAQERMWHDRSALDTYAESTHLLIVER
jgi:hypothetical protein